MGSSEDQQYWLFAIIAARLAAEAALTVSGGKTRSWTEVCEDERYKEAKSQTQLPENTGDEQRPTRQEEKQPVRESPFSLRKRQGCSQAHSRRGKTRANQVGTGRRRAVSSHATTRHLPPRQALARRWTRQEGFRQGQQLLEEGTNRWT